MKRTISHMMKFSLAVAAVSLIGTTTAGATEVKYPSKPITIYYGYKAGGTCHVSLQALCQGVEKALGQPVVLVEKPGASASIAGGAAAKANPDGYSLGCIKSTTITTAPHEYKLPYSPTGDLEHLFAYAGPPSGFAVKDDYPRKTWKEFIDYAKENPGKVSWTATGNMGTQFLIMNYIAKREGIKWNGVPSAGGAEAMKLVLGGQVDGYAASGSHIPHIKGGRAKELVDFSDKSSFPGVPTLQEVGYSELAVSAEPYIIVAPKGLPADIRTKLEEAFLQAAQTPEYLAIVEKLDMQPVNLKGSELQEMLKNDDILIRMLLKETGKGQQ